MLLKHVLRNAMIPILTNIGLALPGIFVGSFLIEVFFSIPGLGREVLLAVNRSDYPVIQAVTVYLAVLTMVINLLDRRAVQAGRSAGGVEMRPPPSAFGVPLEGAATDRRAGSAAAAGGAGPSIGHAARRRGAEVSLVLPSEGRPRRASGRKACGRPRGGAFARPGRHGVAGRRARLPGADRAGRRWAWWHADWQREVGVPNAPPTFSGAAPADAAGDRGAEGPERRPVRRRPAGAALQGMGRAGPPS